MNKKYLIVGAGFAGSVLAERIASQLNSKVIIVEKRNHIGGNAYDEYDEHGILVHKYGPHIFHTNDKKVFDYLSRFTKWRLYEHKVLANYNGRLYPIPINRITINKLYAKNYSSDEEVAEFLDSVKQGRNPILNSEDIIVNQVGYDLFNKFYRSFTIKQWGVEPKNLAPSVCGRIPIRTNEDCRYFVDKYQFMPKDGYTKIFERMLRHENIEIVLNTNYESLINDVKFDKMIYTGEVDKFFNCCYGKLSYRSVEFKYENYNKEYFLDSSSINYVDNSTEYTRATENKRLAGQKKTSTTITYEFPQAFGDPYYPLLDFPNIELYKKYSNEMRKIKSVLFIGRLAEYKYYNMDQIVAKCLHEFKRIRNGF